MRGDHLSASIQGHVDHHPALDEEITLADVLERGEHLFQREFGQIAQPAEIDPEHRNLSRPHKARSAENRPVAAEHHDQVDVFGQHAVRLGQRRAPRLRGDGVDGPQLDAPRLAPFAQIAYDLQRLGLLRPDNRADGFEMKQWQIPTSNVVSYKTIATGAIVHAARNRSKRIKREEGSPEMVAAMDEDKLVEHYFRELASEADRRLHRRLFGLPAVSATVN